MISTERIQAAIELVEWIRVSVHDQPLTANERNLVAVPCYAITQDQHHAIVLLTDHQLFASSFALLRIAFESYIRGVWLSLCATDAEIEKFNNGWEPPNITKLLNDVEATPGFLKRFFHILKRKAGKQCVTSRTLVDCIHNAGIRAMQSNPTTQTKKLRKFVQLSEILAIMSVIGLAEVIGNDALAYFEFIQNFNFNINPSLATPPLPSISSLANAFQSPTNPDHPSLTMRLKLPMRCG